MKKLDKQKLVNEFKHIRDRVKTKLKKEEILDEFKAARKSN